MPPRSPESESFRPADANGSDLDLSVRRAPRAVQSPAVESVGRVRTRSLPADHLLSIQAKSEFTYEPLRVLYDEIRLVRINRAWSPLSNAGINLELRTYSLQHAPSYVALSYAWGDDLDDSALYEDITCNGHRLSIKRNLAVALRTVFSAVQCSKTNLNEQGEWILVWADGICINQEDSEEKTSQVSLMKDIYSYARGTIAYVG
ncbi:heterokaryon incompatibility protein-domain-containing protein, partial [Lineolata rhizophorae]